MGGLVRRDCALPGGVSGAGHPQRHRDWGQSAVPGGDEGAAGHVAAGFPPAVAALGERRGLLRFGKYFTGKTRAQAYREYAEAKAESILDWEDFDSVAHIGYVAKFSIYTGKERALVYEDAPDAFDAIFRHVIALGKCIEVNTSGYATTGDTFAHSSLIRRYIELGGENFTFGSDSHDTARDYADVERAKEMVRALGGKYQVSFEGRKAIYWKI